MLRALAALLVLPIASCSGAEESLGGPVALSGPLSLDLAAPVRTTGLFHQLCFALPPEYAVDENFRGLLGSSGEIFALRATLRDLSGRAVELRNISLLTQDDTRFACLSSEDLVGRRSESFTEIEIFSGAAWITPEVRWLSVEKL